MFVSDDEPLIDPDCRDGKCGSCVGEPCQHSCHKPTAGADSVFVGLTLDSTVIAHGGSAAADGQD